MQGLEASHTLPVFKLGSQPRKTLERVPPAPVGRLQGYANAA